MPFNPLDLVGPVVGGALGWLNQRSRNKQIKEQNRRIDARLAVGDRRAAQGDRYAADDNQRMMDLRPRVDANYDRRNQLANDLFGGNTSWERVGFNSDDIENDLSGLNSRDVTSRDVSSRDVSSRDVNERVFDEYANTGGWDSDRKRNFLDESTAGARQATGNVLNEMRRQGAATGSGLAGFLANRASRDFSRGVGDVAVSALNRMNESIDSGRQWGATGRAGLNVGNADRALIADRSNADRLLSADISNADRSLSADTSNADRSLAAAQARLQGRLGLNELGLRAALANQNAGLQAQDLDLRRYGMGLGALENLGAQDLNETGMYMSGRNSMYGGGNSLYASGNQLMGGYGQQGTALEGIMGGVGSAGPLVRMFQDWRNRGTRSPGQPTNNYMIAGGSGYRRGGGMYPVGG